MNQDLREPIRRQVGGSLRGIPPRKRLGHLRINAIWLRGGQWEFSANDGIHVRKAVGATR